MASLRFFAAEYGATAVDRLASELLLTAASLLLLQSSLAGKTAQAFLQVLQNLRTGRVEGLLESYGTFYRELLSAGYSSWQDCLLDEARPPLLLYAALRTRCKFLLNGLC